MWVAVEKLNTFYLFDIHHYFCGDSKLLSSFDSASPVIKVIASCIFVALMTVDVNSRCSKSTQPLDPEGLKTLIGQDTFWTLQNAAHSTAFRQ